mgnify:CR=1 FL=1
MKEIDEDVKKLVIARLRCMPDHFKVSIGTFGSFDKWQLIEEVKKGSEIGKFVVKVHLNYLRSFKKSVENEG